MIKIIGLMVASYALARMAQVPIEMSGAKDVWLGLPFQVRFFILAGISAFAFLVIGILTLLLLASS